MRFVRAGLLLLLLSPAARAEERFDHRGSVSLLAGGGSALRETISYGAADSGLRGLADLGGTWSVGHDGNELVAWIRASLGGRGVGWGGVVGYRSYFGYDRLKTFLDLDVALQIRPILTVGPRLGGGVQWELSPNVGMYLGMALQMGLVNGLLLSGELYGGLQFRSYLLEP